MEYKRDLKALREVVEEVQTSAKSREKDIEALNVLAGHGV
jgi:hypothetical protein